MNTNQMTVTLKANRKMLQENSMYLADVKESLKIEVAAMNQERISSLSNIKQSLEADCTALQNSIHKLSTNVRNAYSITA